MSPHGSPLMRLRLAQTLLPADMPGAGAQPEDPVALGGHDQRAADDERLAVHRVAELLGPRRLQRRTDAVGGVARPGRRAVVGPPGCEGTRDARRRGPVGRLLVDLRGVGPRGGRRGRGAGGGEDAGQGDQDREEASHPVSLARPVTPVTYSDRVGVDPEARAHITTSW